MHARMSFRLGTTGPTRNFNRHQKWKMQPAAASAVLRDYLASRQSIEGVVMQTEDALQGHAPVAETQKEKSSKHLLRRRRLTPFQFVEALQSYMPKVLLDITVDYIALTKTCNELMRTLRARLEDGLRVGVPTLAYPGDSNDHGFLWMVLQILEEARREEQVWNKQREAGEERFKGGAQLRLAAETVEAFLNEHGGG